MDSNTPLPPRSSNKRATGSAQSNKPIKTGKPMKKRKRIRWGRIILLLVVAVVLFVGWFVVDLYFKADKAIGEIALPGQKVTVPPDQSVKVKPTAVLLLGLDSRVATGTMNTDVIMIAAMNPRTKKSTIVTVPRDTRIEINGYASHKANSYYSAFYHQALKDTKDKDQARLEALDEMKTMFGRYFGIEIGYASIINFQGFSDVVDALGGVEVDVDMDMHYVDKADKTTINLTKGRHTLDGDEALDFVRYRKSNDGKNMSSDFDRNKRQGEVIGEIVDRLKSLGGATKIGSVIEAVSGNLRTDIPESELRQFMFTYFGMGRSDVAFKPLEGKWVSPYVRVNEQSLADTRQALRTQLSE
ncbi:LCP family protein [Paenibacillus sp. MMS18-CY102]|uniref:LCP family protein n=1 Tax=Paenibacillus sp. MMS18-CY102 TaxID=2682849 RepID=UPI00136600AF|nr:LCP family protein [Paenibacillus sp. MMS18-CY102]MWC27464.1 LytR family transcriptional regulator [Paenibacillus sp. MMS18-CY102]